MKTGQSLQSLAALLESQIESRKDYIAPQKLLSTVVVPCSRPGADVNESDIALAGLGGAPMPMTDHAHGQIAGRLEIPKKYYDRMRAEEPELLAKNVNTWLAKGDDKKMVRTLDGKVRAFLTDRFRPLDNFDLARTALPVLINGKARVLSSEVTDLRLYVKAIYPDLCQEVPEILRPELGKPNGGPSQFTDKDMIIASVMITNSEVGAGSLRVEAGFYKTKCTNLAVFEGSAMKKYHVGRSSSVELDSAVELFSNETRKADDTAFWMKVRDVIAASCNREAFEAQMVKVRKATGERIVSKDIPKVIEMTRRVLGLADGLQNDLLTHLIQGGDLTQWGLLNAITRTAEDQKSYDDATDLERAGGKILELSPSDWKVITNAAA